MTYTNRVKNFILNRLPTFRQACNAASECSLVLGSMNQQQPTLSPEVRQTYRMVLDEVTELRQEAQVLICELWRLLDGEDLNHAEDTAP